MAVDPPAGVAQLPKDKPAAASALGLDYARSCRREENLALLGQVIEVLGNEVRSEGQETLAFTDGTVRVDRTAYPVVYNPKLHQRIILDPDEKIPASLKSKLKDPSCFHRGFALDARRIFAGVGEPTAGASGVSIFASRAAGRDPRSRYCH